MLHSSGKRTATSPLSSEFDKKFRIGLTDEEVDDLNKNVCYWIRNSPHYALLNVEDVPTSALALSFQQVAINMLGTGRASTIDKSWLKAGYGEERLNLLAREVRLDLASIWVEARDRGEWERFANHRALHPSYSSLHHKSTQLRAALLQVETPTVESGGVRAYARLRDEQEAGTFIGTQILHLRFCLLCPLATEKSWEYPFQGNATRGLWEHIETHYNPSDYRVYAHYAAIVQSSGMGKSRTVDELAKDHFVIPLNLREATSTGACGFRSGRSTTL